MVHAALKVLAVMTLTQSVCWLLALVLGRKSLPNAASGVDVLLVGLVGGGMCLASGVGRAGQEVAGVALCPCTFRCRRDDVILHP